MLKFFSVLICFLLLNTSNVFAEEKPVVLFDEGHGQFFLTSKQGVLDLSSFAGVFKEEGVNVLITKEKISKNLLSGVKGLIISGPFKDFSDEEISAIYEFVNDGGRLVAMLHISKPLDKLLNKFGVEVTKLAVSEKQNLIGKKNINFHVKDMDSHALFDGIESFAVFGCWGFIPNEKNVKMIAKSSDKSWIDENRNGKQDDNEKKGAFGIVAYGTSGKGEFLFFGDDAIFQNNFLVEDNLKLAKNLVGFLKK